MSRRFRRLGLPGFLALALGAGLACASPSPGTPPPAPESNVRAPLTGAELMQQLRAMRRAHRSLIEFHAALSSLHYRGNTDGERTFCDFVDAYLGLHLDPLLGRSGRHPELLTLDANLRVTQAALLQRMGERRRATDVVHELEQRFAGREELLVDYPIGEQSTLESALERLRSQRPWPR